MDDEFDVEVVITYFMVQHGTCLQILRKIMKIS